MIRYFLIFILLKSILFGCSLCSIYTPRTHVSTQIKADKEYIKTLKINWVFANEFTKELLQIYDKNLDSSFDEKELALIQTALIDYLKPKNFITSISYDKQINEKSNTFEIKDYKMSYKNSTLSFEYNIDLNYKIYDKNILNINIFDNQGKEAFEYLSNRGLTAQFVKENYIGFSYNSWDKLLNDFTQKGYTLEDLLNVGLIKKGDKGYYDTFRNRIMFPITNASGKTVAFGGRTLEDRKDIAKYLNSSDTVLFNKRKNLYGFKEKGTFIRKKNYSILMEGYMDVLKAHSFGFDTAIA